MKRRGRGRYETQQGRLFHPKQVIPAWETLPVETRRTVTRLVARMLRAYQARHPAAGALAEEEVRND